LLTYQCNVCRQTVNLADNEQIGACPRCGSLFVVPNQFRDNANKRNIYRLADEALANRNFDVALTYYKRILMVDAKETAAHWGFLLSKYGVEISGRGDTYQHVIFHRLERELFTDDPSYETMVTYCPKEALYYYQGLSRIIAQQQQKMLAISQRQQPYDIYLNCTAAPGTEDYMLANQVGLALDQAGYRVFLPATMLSGVPQEDKNLYEMAIAEKAQAMIVVATASTDKDDARYLAAWKRFLAYRRQDAGRKMLSVFQGIVPEQLPMELQPLQSIKCEGSNFRDEVLTKINEMFGRKNQDVSITRRILDYLRQADDFLTEGNYNKAADLYRQVRELDAEEARAHWGLVCAATKNLTVPVFSDATSTDYQRALQFAQGPQREQYQKAMCALMAEPAWDHLMQLTDNLKKVQAASQKNVQAAIANVHEYLAKDDPRLGKIEKFYERVKLRQEVAQLKNAYENRDVIVEPLFAEQGIAENDYNTCERNRSEFLKGFSGLTNLLLVPMVLLIWGQICMMDSYAFSYDYEGPAYGFAKILYIAAAAIMTITAFLLLRYVADEMEWRFSFKWIAAAAIAISCYESFKGTVDVAFLFTFAFLAIFWLLLRVIAAIISSNVKRSAGQRKKAANRVYQINQRIEESYRRNMQALYQKYDVAVSNLPEYTAKNSQGFYIHPEKRSASGPLFIVISAVVILAGLAFGATAISNYKYATGWKDITAVAATSNHVVGLREDGTCIANGRNRDGQCNVDHWKNVVKIDVGSNFTVALLEDGTVRVANDEEGRFDAVKNWKNIVDIDASSFHILALKSDGTCVSAGSSEHGADRVSHFKDVAIILAGSNIKGPISIAVNKSGNVMVTDIPNWNGIREFLASDTGSGEGQMKVTRLFGTHESFVGTTDDGGCAWFGENGNNQLEPIETWDTSQLKQIHVGEFSIGLRYNGTAIFTGNEPSVAAQITTWTDVQELSGSDSHVLGLKNDGHVRAAGSNIFGKSNVEDWENIREVYAADSSSYGICEDGTVVSVGAPRGGLAYTTPKNPLELIEFWYSTLQL